MVRSPVVTVSHCLPQGGDDRPSPSLLGRVPPPNVVCPIDIFNEYVTVEMRQKVVDATNRHVHQMQHSPRPPYIRSGLDWPPKFTLGWKDVNLAEFDAWLGLNLAFGVHRLPSIRDYWRSDWLFSTPQFASVMPRNRFQAISSSLRLVDYENPPPDADKVGPYWKVRPWLAAFRENCMSNYCLGRHISLDEEMALSKHRTRYKYIKQKKPIPEGFKFVCITSTKGGAFFNLSQAD